MTDVYMQPRREVNVERTYAVQDPAQRPTGHLNIVEQGGLVNLNQGVPLQQTEMAAFEKGRMQGEMEAIRRMEAEAPLKQMPGAPAVMPVDNLIRPDVIEINRLTNLQRISWVLGELTGLGMIALALAWIIEYHGGFGWGRNGDQFGNIGHFNVGVLTFALGLFAHSQAISNYRVLPLRTPTVMNSLWYCLCTSAAIIGYIITLTAVIMSTPEAKFWAADHWVLAAALGIFIPHALWSMFRALGQKAKPVKYETWAEVNNNLDDNSGRILHDTHANANGSRNHTAHHGVALHADDPRRTIYTPAPRNIPATHSNVAAPANAPRWAENPHTHAENFFLLWRAKWAVVAYWSMGAAFLMMISSQQHIYAAGRDTWSQGSAVPENDEEIGFTDSRHSHVLSALGLLTAFTLVFISYMAMPPRTTLVKNGIVADTRRASISHNAETRLGNEHHHGRDHHNVV